MYNNSSWAKRLHDRFDVVMGAYNCGQIADLVGMYILDNLSSITDTNQLGHYRDDGL